MLLKAGLFCVAGELKKEAKQDGKCGFGSARWLGRYHRKSFGDFFLGIFWKFGAQAKIGGQSFGGEVITSLAYTHEKLVGHKACWRKYSIL